MNAHPTHVITVSRLREISQPAPQALAAQLEHGLASEATAKPAGEQGASR